MISFLGKNFRCFMLLIFFSLLMLMISFRNQTIERFQVRTNMQNSRTLLDCDQIFKHNIARYRDVCFDSPNISASSFESSNASDAEFLGPTYVRLPYFSDNSISISKLRMKRDYNHF